MKKRIVFSLFIILAVFCVTGCNKKVNSAISNSTWKASDSSEVVFTDKTINWYQTANDHSDNYYTGTYKFYRGEKAVKYITTELSKYGVTETELDKLFSSSKVGYKKANFVVVDITYDKLVIAGETKNFSNSKAPWYGFILENDTYLDVANMNTGSYYKFTKQSIN